MSNPTNPFSWQMPTPTDLVTDLPADFEVFGQAVATSLADLLGGTTGQVLSKTTNADMDFTWVAANPGDITGVTAGTGISGGGTSGTVTVTNDMATTITASGDIIVGTGSGTYDNLPIGTTAQVLTADTTVSPYKVKWATPAAASFVGCLISNTNVTVSIANNTNTKVAMDTELIDTDGFHDNSTNNTRITIPAGKAGKYLVSGNANFASNATGDRNAQIWKNNTEVCVGFDLGGSGNVSPQVSRILDLAVADYVEFVISQSSGGNLNSLWNSGQYGWFQVIYLGA